MSRSDHTQHCICPSQRAAFQVLLEFRFLSFAEVPDFEYYWTPTLHLSQEDIRDDEAEIRGLDPDLCVEVALQVRVTLSLSLSLGLGDSAGAPIAIDFHGRRSLHRNRRRRSSRSQAAP